MADEAVDVLRIAEVERVVLVAIARVALRTTAFVARYANTEVVENVILAMWADLEALDIRRDAFPLPVRRREELVGHFAVAVEARLGAFVRVLREVACVQLVDLIGARRIGIAVINVDDAVPVDIFVGITNAVVVEVPASLAIGAISSCSAVLARCAIVALATCQPEAKAQDHQEKGATE